MRAGCLPIIEINRKSRRQREDKLDVWHEICHDTVIVLVSVSICLVLFLCEIVQYKVQKSSWNYLAVGIALARRIQEDTAILNRSVYVGDHGAHVPGTVGLSGCRIFLRMYIFLDRRIPRILVAFINTASNRDFNAINTERVQKMYFCL